MSIDAMVWVFSQDIRPSHVKFVLLALADNASVDGRAWPCIETIALKTSQDRKTVIAALDKLEEMCLLVDTGDRVGKTRQVKVYRLNGLPSETRHYVYKLINPNTGEFYIGVRSTTADLAIDGYMGSGLWPMKMARDGVGLEKVVVQEFSSRPEAEIAGKKLVLEYNNNPLCMNKTNSTKCGTLTKCETVPSTDGKSPVHGTRNPKEPKEDINTPYSPPLDDFEDLWKKWTPYDMPKGSKSLAKKSYLKARKDTDHEAISRGAEKYCAYCQSSRLRTRHVATWLNQRGWEDDLPEAKGPQRGSAYADTIRDAGQAALDYIHRSDALREKGY